MTGWKCLSVAFLCFCLAGCAPLVFVAGTATGVAGYKYYQGALSVIYQAPYSKTFEATLKVLENMQFDIEKKEQDLAKGSISARRADGKPITVSLKYRTTNETDVKIRVGVFGDESASNVIKEKIGEELFK